jgi:F-type H+-transporting ATPase subunit a
MGNSGIGPEILFTVAGLPVTSTVVTTWLVMVLLGGLSWLLTRHLRQEPGLIQTSLEIAVSMIETAIREVAPNHVRQLMPFIGTLWTYIVVANLIGLIPGLHSPTRDLSATAALAILVFLSVHWYGIRTQGLKSYLRHYLSPSPLMLPFHLMSEVSRTVALAVRLFGNMMSLEMAAVLILLVAGLLVPIPILMLHIIEALVQAYIFGMLALIYIAGGLQSQELQQQSQTKE